MNRVYKVIWSKAKHCYVVTSEIAKSHTKGESTGRGLKKLAAALLVAAALMGPNFAWAADTATVTDTSGKEQTVYTQEGANGNFATKTELNAKANAADVANTYVNKTDAQVTNLTASGNVSAGSFTNGAATMSNGSLNGINQINATGNIVTTSNMRAHDITAEGDIKGNAITGTSLNTQGGTISGGAITGTTITGTSLNTQNGEINGGDIKSGGIIIAKGKITGNGLNAGSGAISGGSLSVTGAMEGNSLKLKGGDLDAGSGTITTTGDINGNNINANGKITTTSLEVTGGLKTDHITLGSETNNYTDINKGNVTSEVDEKVSGVEYTAESIFNKDGSSITARADVGGPADSTGKSIVGAKEISQYLGDAALPDDSKKNVTRSMVRNGDTFYMEDKAEDKTVDGKNKYSTVRQNAGERTVTVTDGENTASTNLTAADIKNTAENGMISNTAKNLVNTASENMTNTVGGNLTTTVTGDSSLKAENITNEAKNKITNKALDVETDAASSIVSKVSNDYGSNTSTQLSHQTTEEMKAEGKTASYLRGAAAEKSELIDGDVKTTIHTVAGQTNTNITDGTNTSNDKQRADQIASSVTDGTNTTVVNQDAKSLASSITDGTKFNNTNNTVDKSEQLIKVDNTHFYAETRTAGSAVEALKSDGNTIISAKDAVTGTVSSAVTDGPNTTGSTMTAKGITNSAAESIVNEIGDGSKVKSEMTAKGITNTAKDGTITNDAKDLVNTASNSITDKVGENVERTMGTKKIEESVKDGTKSNTFTKTAKKDMNIITDGTNTSTLSQLADKVNTSLKEVDGAGNTTKSLNNVKTVSEDTTKMTDAASGEFSKRSQTVSQIQDKVGKTTVTTTDGLTELTNEDRNHKTVMDYANVTRDLNVNGDATVDQKLTVKGDSDLQGNATVGKNLEVKGTSNLKGDVTMESNATVKKDLTVNGKSTFNDKVTIKKNGLDVKDGTTTDTLTVTETSEFRGKADFKDNVSMGKGLAVAGETKTGTLHVEKDGYVGGNLNVDGNIETHDAVLSADSRQVVTGRQLYQTNERVDRLDNRIKKVGANAAALAALRPGDFNPDDKFSIAAGFGSYRNANAAALGLFYRPNENVLLSLGTSFGDGENMVNAGVSVKFGRGKSMAERRKEMADEVSSMRDEMRNQDERIAELEEMLKKQSELIEKLSKES
ncbi:ESPR-type extended signal peptide-containing protein [Dialister succinatiphilus]|jgi:hypothetical protein|uniref:ESPR-type extended signal peptide-containing protein n=1 Tax=Dialister succinatiphilus TaxID=487173 RepID=UPI002357B350|nr:ESPR-type extended signal peptide-containing protein [Dialister succinatiphilus]